MKNIQKINRKSMSNFLINSLQFGDGKYTITLPELEVWIDNNMPPIHPDRFHLITNMDMPNEDGMMMVVDFKNILELISSTVGGLSQADLISAIRSIVSQNNGKIIFEIVNTKFNHAFIISISSSIDYISLFESSAIVQVEAIDEATSIAHVSLLNFYKYYHSHTGLYTPAGTVTAPTFTGEGVSYTPAGTVTTPTFTGEGVSYTPAGTVTAPTFTGEGVSYTPAGTVTAPTFTGEGVSYTPAGTIGAPTFTGTEATVTSDAKEIVTGVTYDAPQFDGGSFPTVDAKSTKINTIDSVADLAVITGVSANNSNIGITGSVAPGTRCLNLSLASGLEGEGVVSVTTSTTDNNAVVKVFDVVESSVIKSVTVTDGQLPSLTGGGINVSTGTHTHNTTIKPEGTVSAPSFSGTAATITAKGTVSAPTFSGTQATITAEGTVDAPTFSGTQATITAKGTVSTPSFSGTTTTITAKGTVSQPKFTGTEATITVS